MISFEIDGIQYRMFDHLYAVSRCGKVLRKFTSYTPTKHPEGYLCLGRQRLMHRVVAMCWLDNPTNASHVHHINEDKSDNRADNLEWLTPKEHLGDRHKGLNGSYIKTDETRNKLRLYRTGRKDSEATRLRKAEVLATNGPKTQCSFQNIVYPSVAAAARVAGIHPTTFRQRCLSKNFSDYKLLII
jgi:hypothetical protein